jgi:hypothetical protein
MGAKGASDITLKGVAWSGGGRKIERVSSGRIRVLVVCTLL